MTAVSAVRLLSALRTLGEPRRSLATADGMYETPRPVRLAGSWLTVDTPTMQVRVVDPQLHLPTASVDFDVLARAAMHMDHGTLVFRGEAAAGLLVDGLRGSWTVPYVTGPTPVWTEADGPTVSLNGANALELLRVARAAVADMSELQVLEYIHVDIRPQSVVVTGSDRIQITRHTRPAAGTTPGELLLPAELVDVLLRLDAVHDVTFRTAAAHHGHGASPAIHATVQRSGGRLVEILAATTDRTYPDLDRYLDQHEPGTPGTWSLIVDAYLLRRALAALAVNVPPTTPVRFHTDGTLTDHDRTASTQLFDADEIPAAALDIHLNLGRLTRLAACLSGRVTVTGTGPREGVHFRDALGVHALLAPVRPLD